MFRSNITSFSSGVNIRKHKQTTIWLGSMVGEEPKSCQACWWRRQLSASQPGAGEDGSEPAPEHLLCLEQYQCASCSKWATCGIRGGGGCTSFVDLKASWNKDLKTVWGGGSYFSTVGSSNNASCKMIRLEKKKKSLFAVSFSWLPCLVDCLLGATPWCSGQHSHISGDVRLTGSSGWMWEWKVVCPDDDNVDIHTWSERKWYAMIFDFFATVFSYFRFLS